MSEPTVKIVDNKRILITSDEYSMYEKICRSYDAEHRKGEDFFRDHFETNGEGIIVFVKPPHNRYSSLEIYCFLVSLMVNQHLRVAQDQCTKLISEATEKYKEVVKDYSEKMDAKLIELDEIIKSKKTE